MPRTIGVFWWRSSDADLWFSQCDGALGAHGGITLRPRDRDAEHLLLGGPPIDASGRPEMPPLARRVSKWRGRYDAARLEHAVAALGRAREDMTMLVYEPPCAFSDGWFEAARRLCARVCAPDDRATHPITLPSTWSFEERAATLLAEGCDDGPRGLPLVCITSGKTLWPGHDERLEFLRRLRRAGVPLALYGRGLPADLGGLGPVLSKASVLRGAAFTLALENWAGGDRYVTEKLWDPLLCWSVPIYHGSAAADGLIDARAFVRLPDLGDGGVACVQAALADPGARAARVDAMAAARRAALTRLRLVEWVSRELGGGALP